MKWKDFLQGVFSDGATPSSSRVLTAIAVAFVCGWGTAVVRHTHHMPDLMGAGAFVGVLYGINTAGKLVKGS